MREKKISGNSRGPKSQSRRVLIVSEGSKTEPNYFRALHSRYRRINRFIKIWDRSPPSPSKVVKCAKALNQKSRNQSDRYDDVFCVFDRDSHGEEDYKRALQLCDGKDSFHAIYSVPCFEYWLLLHLEYTTGGFADCTKVEEAIKKHIPKYDKTSKDIIRYFVTDEKITEAIKRAGKNRVDAKKTGRKSPMTNVDELVEYLKNPEKNDATGARRIAK